MPDSRTEDDRYHDELEQKKLVHWVRVHPRGLMICRTEAVHQDHSGMRLRILIVLDLRGRGGRDGARRWRARMPERRGIGREFEVMRRGSCLSR